MSYRSVPDYRALLEALGRSGVKFIVVGGVSATLQGSTHPTFDLDIVHERSGENVERLLMCLQQLDTVYRHNRSVRPNASHLMAGGHNLLLTTLGPLDCLGTLAVGQGYEQLLPETLEMKIEPGLIVKLLDLAAVIRSKEEAGRDKDLASLPELRSLLRERGKG